MQKTTDTQSKIEKVFIKLYSKKPLENIKVTDICDLCEISRGTFYYHYSDVIDICESIENRIIEEMEADLNNTMLCSFLNQIDQSNLTMFIDEYSNSLKKYIDKKDIYSVLMNGSHGKQFVNKWIMSVRSKNEMNFKYINLNSESQEWMGTFLAAGLVNMLGRWIDRGCKDDPKIIAEVFARVLFRGSIVSHK